MVSIVISLVQVALSFKVPHPLGSLTENGLLWRSLTCTGNLKSLLDHIQFVLSVIWEIFFELCIHPIVHLNV